MDSIFTDKEREYLAAHQLGRLATIGPDDGPDVVPVGYRFNSDGTIDIGGPRLSTSRKFHNVEARPRAAFVVDDTVPEESGPFRAGVGRGIEVRGRAEALVGVEPPGLGATSSVTRWFASIPTRSSVGTSIPPAPTSQY